MKNILVIDDSKTILAIIKEEILNVVVEANIVTGESYKEAQKLIQENEFHVAVLDVHLPDANNGEVIDLVLEHGIPVVVLSSGMNQLIKNIVLKKNIIEYVAKSDPVTVGYVASVVKRVLNNYNEHILIVDDSKSSRALAKMHLEKLKINVLEACSAKEAIDIINDEKNDIALVLTDYEMPEMDGMELTMHLRQSYSKDHLAIIALSASSKKTIATDFLRHGANDFISKPFTYEEFSTRININLEMIELFRETRDNANKDFLTGMYNRRFFFESGHPIFGKAKRKNSSLAVVMLDIDHFKNVNDTYGHDIGDIAIKEIAVVLNKMLRETDLLARFGGEEFCILLDNISLEDIKNRFEEIRDRFEKNIITVGDVSISYTVSIGVCYGLTDSLEDMIKISDDALYEAKNTGRNRVYIIENKQDM